MKKKSNERHWKIALQLAPQLPSNYQDALAILDCVGELVGLAYGKPARSGSRPEVIKFPEDRTRQAGEPAQ